MTSDASRLPAEARLAPSTDDDFAAALRGFGPVGILAILVILFAGNLPLVPLGAILALLWVRWSHTPWPEIGYARPTSWTRSLVAGTALGIAFKLLMKAIVMPLFGAAPVNSAYHYLAGNRAALPGAVWTMIVVAGFGEETVFRGFLFERFRKLFGSGAGARTMMLLLTSLLFGAAHWSIQGLAGAEQAMITGLVFGITVMITGRIWVAMFAHAAFDLTALAMIYWNVESRFAHLVFR